MIIWDVRARGSNVLVKNYASSIQIDFVLNNDILSKNRHILHLHLHTCTHTHTHTHKHKHTPGMGASITFLFVFYVPTALYAVDSQPLCLRHESDYWHPQWVPTHRPHTLCLLWLIAYFHLSQSSLFINCHTLPSPIPHRRSVPRLD